MTGCRIGKVTPKDRKLSVIPTQERKYCHNSVVNMGERLDNDTIMTAFVILYNDRTTCTGWSHEDGVTNNDLVGAAEILKQDIVNRYLRK